MRRAGGRQLPFPLQEDSLDCFCLVRSGKGWLVPRAQDAKPRC